MEFERRMQAFVQRFPLSFHYRYFSVNFAKFLSSKKDICIKYANIRFLKSVTYYKMCWQVVCNC